MAGPDLGAVPMVLAGVAVLAVLGTATTAAVVAVGGDSPERPAASQTSPGDPLNPSQTGGDVPDPAFPEAQVGDYAQYNARFEVPSSNVGWTEPRDGFAGTVYWELGQGERLVLKGPAVYGANLCRDGSLLAFAGMPKPIVDDGQALSEVGYDVLTPYAEAAGYNLKTDTIGDISPPQVEEVTLTDGTPGVITRVTISVPPGENRCNPKEMELNAVSFDSGDYLVTILLGRDLDFPDAVKPRERRRRPLVTEDQRDRILYSARPLAGSPS
jgi:hypothetical protein